MSKNFIGYIKYWVILTYANLLFGLTAIILTISGYHISALLFFVASAIFDFFDGKIARRAKRTEKEKQFGAQLDSFADIVSFGVFPVVFCYSIGLTSIIAYIIYGAYLLASVIRLAWFNISIENTKDDEPNKYFTGFPVTSVAFTMPYIYAYSDWLGQAHNTIMLIIMAALALSYVYKVPVKKMTNKGFIIYLPVIVVGFLKLIGLY